VRLTETTNTYAILQKKGTDTPHLIYLKADSSNFTFELTTSANVTSSVTNSVVANNWSTIMLTSDSTRSIKMYVDA